ncbi:MAG: hypothetical protein HY243_10390 [Proteobacteria bacterium]|nr:hypothetical protein [Pseudomonadota bacterium]
MKIFALSATLVFALTTSALGDDAIDHTAHHPKPQQTTPVPDAKPVEPTQTGTMDRCPMMKSGNQQVMSSGVMKNAPAMNGTAMQCPMTQKQDGGAKNKLANPMNP